MLRIAQFSDIHYASSTLAEADRCFTFAVDAAIGRGIDCAVISGDSTDHALDVHVPAVEALARNVRRLADHCPVLMLQGTFSHEPPGTLEHLQASRGTLPRACRRSLAPGRLARRRPLVRIAGLAVRATTGRNDARCFPACRP